MSRLYKFAVAAMVVLGLLWMAWRHFAAHLPVHF